MDWLQTLITAVNGNSVNTLTYHQNCSEEFSYPFSHGNIRKLLSGTKNTFDTKYTTKQLFYKDWVVLKLRMELIDHGTRNIKKPVLLEVYI